MNRGIAVALSGRGGTFMSNNLVLQRSEPSIWDREGRSEWDLERWLAAMAAGACLAYGIRQRSFAGFLATVGGSGLAWWAAAGADERRLRRGQLRAAWSRRHDNGDIVMATGEESFPASDAPSWTPTTGNTGPSPTAPALPH
jgi:hypothetical protein